MKFNQARQCALCVRWYFVALFIFTGQIAFAYEGSSYNAVKNRVFADPYTVLPQYKVTKKHFGKAGKNTDNNVLEAGKRTLSVQDDFWHFPHGQKLFQANGICFAGRWVIDKESPYTGQFQYLTESRVIARASVALSGTKQTNKRAFGIAVKLFPAEAPDTVVPTLNAFVMHSMGGVVTPHVLDLASTNEPPLGRLPPISQLRTAYRLLKDFKTADKVMKSKKPDVGYRPVAHLAVSDNDQAVHAPTWLRLRASSELPRISAEDFRDELRVEHYPGQTLTWQIDVASGKRKQMAKAEWVTIGKLVMTESITSATCDKTLHFAHPIIRE